MTAQPTRDQLRALALRKDAEAHQPDNHTPDLCGDPECVATCVVDGVEWPCETAWLRDQLVTAEQCIRDLTQEVRDERGAARDQMEQVQVRDARIQAVRDMHYPAHNNPARTPVCETCKGAPGIHECGCWQDEQQLPVCGHCRGWKGMGPVEWPCATIRALD